MGDPVTVHLILHEQRVPMDPVRDHQQHLHEFLQGGRLIYRLSVHGLHDRLHPLNLPGHLAAAQEGTAPHGAAGQCAELRRGLDQGAQCQTGPVLGDRCRAGCKFTVSGLHPWDSLPDGVGLVQ